jgi:hypothetical protein
MKFQSVFEPVIFQPGAAEMDVVEQGKLDRLASLSGERERTARRCLTANRGITAERLPSANAGPRSV